MVEQWWEDLPLDQLTQGDVILSLPQGKLVSPVVYLRHASMKAGASGWMESPEPVLRGNLFRMMAEGRVTSALVVSHSCEIDKGKARILVAPVAIASTLAPEQKQKVFDLKSFAHVPPPAIPQLGDCFADLRSIGSVHADDVSAATRISSMTQGALLMLQARLVGFLTRLVPPFQT